MESTANVINVEGSLDEILLQLDPKTLWHGEQIVAERIMELTTTTGIMAYSIYPTLAAKDFFLPNVLYFQLTSRLAAHVCGPSEISIIQLVNI